MLYFEWLRMLMVTLSVLLTLAASESTLTLNSTLGKIKGITTSVSDGNTTYNIRIFRNIPYAKAPVGDLRFRKPIPFGKWNGVRDGTKFGPSCIQGPPDPFASRVLPNKNISEDCLQLNIYTPVNASPSKASVMVWIHGGAYIDGRGMMFDGSYLAGIGEVVVVTINYRLNVFGFLSTMDDLSPGNYGLWDQQLALRWVNENIGDYGGDKNSVTIFGESAGGFSVGLQALNPENKGLFQRVIAQSGIGNTLLATSQISRFATRTFANFTHCPDELSSDMMQCLRNKTAEELIQSFMNMSKWYEQMPESYMGIAFAPVVDNKFLNSTPQNMVNEDGLEMSFYESLDVLIGTCESEGSLLASHFPDGISLQFLCNTFIPTLVSYYFNNKTYLINAMCDQYNTTLSQQSMNAVNLYGDIFFYSPAVKSLRKHANSSTKSHFQYMSKRKSIFSDTQEHAKWFVGAGHASELPFLFPYSDLANATTDDRANSILLMKYWTNFAKTG